MMNKNIKTIQLFEEWVANNSQLNEGFLNSDITNVLDLVKRWLNKNLEKDIVVYVDNMEEILQNETHKVYGVRFWTSGFNAFRLNWSKKPKNDSKKITSIDFWIDTEDNVPNYTISTSGLNIVQILAVVLSMLKFKESDGKDDRETREEVYIESFLDAHKSLDQKKDKENVLSESVYGEGIKSSKLLTDIEEVEYDKLKNKFYVKGVKSLSESEKKRLVYLISKNEGFEEVVDEVFEFKTIVNEKNIDPNEESKTDKVERKFADDLNIKQKFKDLNFLIRSIANGINNSLIVTGTPGVGKTYTVKETLEEVGLRKGDDFVMVTGKASPLGMYSELYYWKDGKVIVFDDCDDVLENVEGIDILKGALDTKPVRNVSWRSSNSVFKPEGKSEEEIQALIDKGKVPNNFDMNSSVIFISNKEKDKLVQKDNKIAAIISRSNVIDMVFTEEEILELIQRIMPDIEVFGLSSIKDKQEVFDVMVRASESGTLTLPLNIRTFIKMGKAKVALILMKDEAKAEGREFNYGDDEWVRIATSYS